jgi:hypothetical protein
MTSVVPYNPLDKHNLGKSVADALLAREKVMLGGIEPFIGAGIYAIYYGGSLIPYQPISSKAGETSLEVPIYVGKAVPPGARKGSDVLNVKSRSSPFQTTQGACGQHISGEQPFTGRLPLPLLDCGRHLDSSGRIASYCQIFPDLEQADRRFRKP